MATCSNDGQIQFANRRLPDSISRRHYSHYDATLPEAVAGFSDRPPRCRENHCWTAATYRYALHHTMHTNAVCWFNVIVWSDSPCQIWQADLMVQVGGISPILALDIPKAAWCSFAVARKLQIHLSNSGKIRLRLHAQEKTVCARNRQLKRWWPRDLPPPIG